MDILALLKYLGFAIAAMSTTWGMIRKTTIDDPSGRKRLTAAGQVAVAMTLLSTIIGMLAYGFERIEKVQGEQAKQERDRHEKEEQANKQRTDQVRHETERRDDEAKRLAMEERARFREYLAGQRSRSERIEQTQKLLLAAQPLRSLRFRIRFQGLNAEQRKITREGLLEVKRLTDAESGDVGMLAARPLEIYRQAALRSLIFYPLLRTFVAEAKSAESDREDAMMLVSLDPSHNLLLPLGAVNKANLRGYLENPVRLRKQVYEPSVANADEPLTSGSGCPMPTIAAEGDSAITVDGDIASPCISRMLQFDEKSFVTAALPDAIEVAILAPGAAGFPFSPLKIFETTYQELCWVNRMAERLPGGSLLVSLWANAEESSIRQYRLRQSHGQNLQYAITNQQKPDDFGRCTPFAMAEASKR
jgi:hypothetical protein